MVGHRVVAVFEERTAAITDRAIPKRQTAVARLSLPRSVALLSVLVQPDRLIVGLIERRLLIDIGGVALATCDSSVLLFS